MGKIDDYAVGIAGPTDKILASDGGTGETKNLLLSDVDSNFANIDLVFNSNRYHDTSGYEFGISTDGLGYIESFIFMTPTAVTLSTDSGNQSFGIDASSSFISANGKPHIECGVKTTRFNQSVSYVVYPTNVSYALTDSDYIVNCANTITISLPTAVNRTGVTYIIKNSGVGTVTIDGNGSETIDGNLTISLTTMKCATVVSDGVNWIITNLF